MTLTKEEIHNVWLYQTGVSEGMFRAGATADCPVLFAEAIIELYELKKGNIHEPSSLDGRKR